jgi:CRP/FNR family transcriptional regulator
VFTVTAGSLRLFQLLPDGRRQIVGFAFAGDFLGLTSGGLYNLSAETLEDSRVCQVPRAEFAKLVQEIPALEHRLLDRTSLELAKAREQMVLLGRKTAGERLATFLLQMQTRLAAAPPGDGSLRLPMTRADIADYLGLTTETVSRTFSRLRALKLIEIGDNDAIRLLRPQQLQALAGGSYPGTGAAAKPGPGL